MNIQYFKIVIFLAIFVSTYNVQTMQQTNIDNPVDPLEGIRTYCPISLHIQPSKINNENEITYVVSGYTKNNRYRNITLTRKKDINGFSFSGLIDTYEFSDDDTAECSRDSDLNPNLACDYWHECNEFCANQENKSYNS